MDVLSPGLAAYCLAMAGLLGACLGSFLNCAALRYVREESVFSGRSHCPFCGHVLGPFELVPLLSFILQRGRCRACKAALPLRYPAAEALLCAVFVSLVIRFGLSRECLLWLGLGCVLFYVALVDIEIMELPDGPMVFGALWFLLISLWMGELRARLLAGLLGALFLGGSVLLLALVMDRVLGRESLGGGDVKLLALLGLYLGWVGGLFLLMLACVLGLVFAALKGQREAFAFGPFIAVSAWPLALWGEDLIRWYLGFF